MQKLSFEQDQKKIKLQKMLQEKLDKLNSQEQQVAAILKKNLGQCKFPCTSYNASVYSKQSPVRSRVPQMGGLEQELDLACINFSSKWNNV